MAKIRIALAMTDNAKDVAQYLPANYSVIGQTVRLGEGILIAGKDNAGWTLDAYVIPRLGSALIYCSEVESLNTLYEVE